MLGQQLDPDADLRGLSPLLVRLGLVVVDALAAYVLQHRDRTDRLVRGQSVK